VASLPAKGRNMSDEMEGQGVTDEAVESPSNGGDGSLESQAGGERNETQQEMISKAEYEERVNNLRAELGRKSQREVQQYKQQVEAAKDAIAFDNWLRTQPREKVLELQNWIQGKPLAGQQTQPQVEQEDPFKEFDPIAAEQFRTVKELKAWQQEMVQLLEQSKQEQQQQQQAALIEHQDSIDDKFKEWLTKDGFLTKDGKPVDAEAIEAAEVATLGMLVRIAKNPEMPTEAEAKRAYELASKGFSFSNKRALRNVTKPNVPHSGSRTGALPSQKPEQSQQARIGRIINAL